MARSTLTGWDCPRPREDHQEEWLHQQTVTLEALQRLSSLHDREVAELRAEVTFLREQLSTQQLEAGCSSSPADQCLKTSRTHPPMQKVMPRHDGEDKESHRGLFRRVQPVMPDEELPPAMPRRLQEDVPLAAVNPTRTSAERSTDPFDSLSIPGEEHQDRGIPFEVPVRVKNRSAEVQIVQQRTQSAATMNKVEALQLAPDPLDSLYASAGAEGGFRPSALNRQTPAGVLRAAFHTIRATQRFRGFGSSGAGLSTPVASMLQAAILPEGSASESEASETPGAIADDESRPKMKTQGSRISSDAHYLTRGLCACLKDDGKGLASRVRRIVTSAWWEGFYALFLLLDLLTLGVEVQLALGVFSGASSHRLLAAASSSVGDTGYGPDPAHGPETYCNVVEHLLTVLFLLDLAIRFSVSNWREYVPSTQQEQFVNCADLVITLVTNLLFVWILPLCGIPTLTSTTFIGLKCLRFLRLQRVVNVIMENRDLFKEVSLIIRGLSVSGRSFLSALGFITIVTYFVGVIGCVTIVHHLQLLYEEEQDPKRKYELADVLHHLGTLNGFMYALAEFASKNPNILPPILKYLEHAWILFYAYAAFLDLVLLNMIEAVAVENALANSEAQEHHKLLGQLAELFVLMDENGDGTLSWMEFKAAFTDPEISQKWKLLDIKQNEAKELFNLLDPGNGDIPMDDFFNGLTRMKGHALSKDVFRIMKTLDDLIQAISIMFTSGSLALEGDQDVSFMLKHSNARKSTLVSKGLESSAQPSEENTPISRAIAHTQNSKEKS